MIKSAKMEEETTHLRHCQSCLSVVNDDELTMFTVDDHHYNYKCKVCFFPLSTCLNSPAEIYIDEKRDTCSICFEDINIIDVFECGHYVCHPCFKNMKRNLNNNNSSSLACPQCRKESKISYTKPYFNKNIKLEYENPFIRDSMSNLYIRVFGKKVSSFVSDYRIPFRKRVLMYIITHHDLIEKFYQYYVWLSILSMSKNGAKTLSPGIFIDKIWHTHILDTVNYREVCEDIAGKFIDHYPDNGNISRSQIQYDNRIRLLKKLQKLNIEQNMLYNAWGFSNEFKGGIPEGEYLFVKTLNCEFHVVSIFEGMKCSDLFKYFKDRNESDPRFVFFGKQFKEDDTLLSDLGITHLSSVFLIRPLRGC